MYKRIKIKQSEYNERKNDAKELQKHQQANDSTELLCRFKRRFCNTYFEIIELGQHQLPVVPVVIQFVPDVFERRQHPLHVVR